VRWNLADTFKLITGANRARVRASGVSYGTERDAGATDTTPFIGALWDFTPHSTFYASYAEIFAQQHQLDINGDFVGDLRGSNAEIGVKSEWLDGRLNTSFAVFRVRQENFAEQAGFAAGAFYHAGVDARSEGFELDVAGGIGENWLIAGGFTRLEIENPQGEPTLAYVPRSTLRLSTVWTDPQIDGLRLGATLRWQSGIERTQSLVLADGQPVVTRQDGYAVLGLMAGYRFGNGWDATLNVDNVTDEKYIASLYWADQGFYAAPRNVALSVGYRF
jgi:outer membrane receptor for ferric coprogen and ferric-rhodotorulic acid